MPSIYISPIKNTFHFVVVVLFSMSEKTVTNFLIYLIWFYFLWNKSFCQKDVFFALSKCSKSTYDFPQHNFHFICLLNEWTDREQAKIVDIQVIRFIKVDSQVVFIICVVSVCCWCLFFPSVCFTFFFRFRRCRINLKNCQENMKTLSVYFNLINVCILCEH